jgi:hypothetical protein
MKTLLLNWLQKANSNVSNYPHNPLVPSPEWDEFTNVSKEFICGLINLNSKARLDCDQALSHNWLSLNISSTDKKNIVGHVGTNLTKHFTGKRATIMKKRTINDPRVKDSLSAEVVPSTIPNAL